MSESRYHSDGKRNGHQSLDTRVPGTFPLWRTLLLLGLIATIGVAAFGLGGPGVLPLETAVVALGVGLAVVSVVLLGVLFSMRANVRAARRERRYERYERRATWLDATETEGQGTPQYASVLAVKGGPGPHVLRLVGVDDETAIRLNGMGVYTTEHLRRADPGQIAEALSRPVDAVRQWQTEADLLQVPGLSPPQAHLLVCAGVCGVDDLAHADVRGLTERFAAAAQTEGCPEYARGVDAERMARWSEAAEAVCSERVNGNGGDGHLQARH